MSKSVNCFLNKDTTKNSKNQISEYDFFSKHVLEGVELLERLERPERLEGLELLELLEGAERWHFAMGWGRGEAVGSGGANYLEYFGFNCKKDE